MDRTPENDALLDAAYELTDHAPTPPPRGRADSTGPLDATSRHLDRMTLLADVAAAYAAVGSHERPAETATPALFAWGALRVRGRLGEGAFGEVFAAWDPALQREVALKLRRAEAGTLRWLDEARSLARVRHPNVLVVHGADLRDGRAGIWSELIRGRTLEEELAASGPLPVREAVRIARDVASALDAVHRTGLRHGDVTTRNVMLEDAPRGVDAKTREAGRTATTELRRAVLMDFGTASNEASAARLGTPYAAAPEQLAGGRATSESDIYALGVLLFRMLTGRYPVEAADLVDLRQRHASGKRAALGEFRRGVPAAVARIVDRALAKDPVQRYASAAAMRDALSRSLGEFVPPVPLWTVGVGLAGLLAIALLGLLVVREVRRRDPNYLATPRVPARRLALRPAWATPLGDTAADLRGHTMAIGADVDGDGYPDAIIGDGTYSAGMPYRGRTIAYRGGPGGLSSSALTLAMGVAQNQRFGEPIAVGDVNGDGYLDLLICAEMPGANPNVWGEAELFLGSPKGLSKTPAWRIDGEPRYTAFGETPAIVPDVNGDGCDEILIPEHDWIGVHRNQGRVLVFLGSKHGPPTQPSEILSDLPAEERFGSVCVGVGDVNGDGYRDVMIGAPWWTDSRGQVGCLCLFLGGPHGLTIKPVQRITGEAADDLVGLSCAPLGDVNGDGFADLAVSAPTHDGRAQGSGEVRVYLGGRDGFSRRPVWRAEGFGSNSRFGMSLASGDLDGDGHPDLIVGAPDQGVSKDRPSCGAVYVYRGTGRLPPFEGQPAWWASSGQPESLFGLVLAVGDVNRDGAADLFVASPMWRNGSVVTSREFLYLGVPSREPGPARTPPRP